MQIRVCQAASQAREIAQAIADLIAGKLRSRPFFNLVLTGGTLGIEVVRELGSQNIDWSRVNIWFGDERFVPLNDPERNEHQALSAWSGLSDANLTRFPDSKQLSLQAAAKSLSADFESLFGDVAAADSVFDLVLLGVGPDGHVASLFPQREHEADWIVAESDSPKPPSERLSLSFEALNRADQVWFIAAGAAKAVAIRAALAGENLPAAKVKGLEATVWFVDQEISDEL